MPDDPGLSIFPERYVLNAESAAYHRKWVAANPGEAARWVAFRDAVIRGEQLEPPTMATKYGKALVAAGEGHMSVSRILGAMVPPYPPAPAPPPTPPPPSTNPIPANGLITQGGTYSGTYTGGTIVVDTSSLVTIVNSTITNTSGDVFRGLGGGFTIRNLTLDNVTINGGPRRVWDVENAQSLVVRNCSIEGTTGMKYSGPMSGAVILVTLTRLRNLQGADGTTTSQFCQFNGVTGATIEVSWNECINTDPNSFAEDLVSIYSSSGVWLHDCFFDGQPVPGNPPSSSQGGITIEVGSSNCLVENNILVATHGLTIYTDAGANNQITNNRNVRSGYYADGVTYSQVGFASLTSFPGAPGFIPQDGNHTHGNVIGYMQGSVHGGGRLDWVDEWMAPDCLPQNIHLAPIGGTVTIAHEEAERTRWQNKVAAAGVVIGAT